jgi:hypothetical protein
LSDQAGRYTAGFVGVFFFLESVNYQLSGKPV